MAKRKKDEHDFAVRAFRVMQEATEDAENLPVERINYQQLGSKGGKKGGKARAAKLSPERRSEIAKKAAAARWAKRS